MRRIAAAYIEKLQALDKAYTEGLSQAKQKSFVTQHAAFNYLALDYGLKQVAISGLSPDADAIGCSFGRIDRVRQEK